MPVLPWRTKRWCNGVWIYCKLYSQNVPEFRATKSSFQDEPRFSRHHVTLGCFRWWELGCYGSSASIASLSNLEYRVEVPTKITGPNIHVPISETVRCLLRKSQGYESKSRPASLISRLDPLLESDIQEIDERIWNGWLPWPQHWAEARARAARIQAIARRSFTSGGPDGQPVGCKPAEKASTNPHQPNARCVKHKWNHQRDWERMAAWNPLIFPITSATSAK